MLDTPTPCGIRDPSLLLLRRQAVPRSPACAGFPADLIPASWPPRPGSRAGVPCAHSPTRTSPAQYPARRDRARSCVSTGARRRGRCVTRLWKQTGSADAFPAVYKNTAQRLGCKAATEVATGGGHGCRLTEAHLGSAAGACSAWHAQRRSSAARCRARWPAPRAGQWQARTSTTAAPKHTKPSSRRSAPENWRPGGCSGRTGTSPPRRPSTEASSTSPTGAATSTR